MSAGYTVPFSRFEWLIAWRYLRAKRSDGGVSVMTWISLLGVALAVFSLIATLSVRSGFRAEFVDTILGSNAHVTVYNAGQIDPITNQIDRRMTDYVATAERIAAVSGVTRAAPLVKGQVMANFQNANAGVEVFGIAPEDLMTIPRIAAPIESRGDIRDFANGIAIGSEVARQLGVTVGDKIRIISPNGTKTAFGTSPRVSAYDVVYVFTAGRWDIDKTRVYMPIDQAQLFFNKDGIADEIEVMVENPDAIDTYLDDILTAAGPRALTWTWQDSSGAFLRALTVEDNVMFVLMSVLVLISSLTIIMGLVMLVKNKVRDIGILRTMGLTEGSILRIFFICGAGIGTVGTIIGVIAGCLFAIYIDPIFSFINTVAGGGVWDPSIRGIYSLPAKLQLQDVIKAVCLSLGLSWTVTLLPARNAARLNPVEALRYE